MVEVNDKGVFKLYDYRLLLSWQFFSASEVIGDGTLTKESNIKDHFSLSSSMLMGSRTLQGSERVAYMGDKGMQQGGVPIMMSVRTKTALMDWMPICMRTIKARFYSKHKS